MGRVRDFINHHNIRLYRCDRCGIIEAPFLRGENIGDYGWYKIDHTDKYLCHKCARHPGIIDSDCVARHNKFVRSTLLQSRYGWLFSSTDFGV